MQVVTVNGATNSNRMLILCEVLNGVNSRQAADPKMRAISHTNATNTRARLTVSAFPTMRWNAGAVKAKCNRLPSSKCEDLNVGAHP
eukprot:1838848-Amphidinium_carterae.3